jgi:hypothetical protein
MQVLDGQNRLAAFRMLKEKYPENKTAIRVMVVDSDKSPLQLAIMFNAKHLNYMEAYLEGGVHGYEQLRDFMKAYPEFELKAGALYLISEKLNTKVVFRRDIVVAFYRVWNKIPNIQTYIKRLSLFKMLLTESRKEWERAYEDLLR